MPVDKHQIARILVVEDEPLISMILEDELVEAGFQIAGVVEELETALALVESGGCDGAIIDANLAGVSAKPVATALAARSLHFIVTSGYSTEHIQGAFPGALFIQKPSRPGQIAQLLHKVFVNRDGQ